MKQKIIRCKSLLTRSRNVLPHHLNWFLIPAPFFEQVGTQVTKVWESSGMPGTFSTGKQITSDSIVIGYERGDLQMLACSQVRMGWGSPLESLKWYCYMGLGTLCNTVTSMSTSSWLIVELRALWCDSASKLLLFYKWEALISRSLR